MLFRPATSRLQAIVKTEGFGYACVRLAGSQKIGDKK